MIIFLVTLTVFVLAMLAMAVGVIMNRKPIQGSCGGLATRDCDGSGGSDCEFCGGANAGDEVMP